MQKKKVKISNVKRSLHLKNKKNFSKPLKKKEVVAPTKKGSTSDTGLKKGAAGPNASNKVFGKPASDKHKKRNKRHVKGALLPPPPPVPSAKSNKTKKGKHAGDSEEEEEEEYNVQDMIDMIDDDHVAEFREAKGKKRKRTEGADDEEDQSAKHFEKEYAQLTNDESQNKKRMVSLLPIKTKGGEVVTRETEVDDDEEGLEPEDELEAEDGDADEEEVDSDDDIVRGDAVCAIITNGCLDRVKINVFTFSSHLEYNRRKCPSRRRIC